ncbi:MAG: NAD(P)/FAD-dependent oxidoreductase [Bacteroidia bacterium]|nr:NAD(P)/FAD-dependent oxidoreductase [Bacteroidia bacterium]
MEKFDLCIIGGGPSGYAAAMRALDFNKKVLLIEKKKLGGAALYNGALWSKTMWEYSQRVAATREVVPTYEVCYNDVKAQIDQALTERNEQMMKQTLLLQERSNNTQTLRYIKGTGKMLSANKVQIQSDLGTFEIETEYIMLATGSRPRKLNHINIDEQTICTSDGLNNFEDFPKSLVILGAGVVGCEFATIFSNFGKTKVHLIDKADRILPFEDEDVSSTVTENLEKNGVVIHKNSSLVRMEIKDGKVEYELVYTDGRREIINVEKALISVGRVGNIENIGLEEVGVKLSAKLNIQDVDTQTNIPNIFVAGDLTSQMALVHVGEREARHAVVRMFDKVKKPIEYSNISTIMFLNPEVASLGMGQDEAKNKNIPVKVVKIDYSLIARAIAMRKTKGFFKIIVSNDKEMKILGMRAVGEHASSAIQAIAYLMYTNQGIEDLANMMHPHPSIIEGIQECLRMLLKKSIYKPSVFKDKLQAFSCVDGYCTPIDFID